MEKRMPRPGRVYVSLLGAAALLCIVAAAVWFAVADTRKKAEPQYMLRDMGGHLALYAADGTGPLAEYEIYTRLLPEQDVLTLQQGLPVQNEAELQQKLEDYGL